ncbi:hypothetical protein Tco_1062433, partial [Tanacetum coccineum]
VSTARKYYRSSENSSRRLIEFKFWDTSSVDFTHPLEIPNGLKGLLYTLNETVIPTKVDMEHRLEAASKHFKSKVVECYTNGDDELQVLDVAR